MLTQLAPTFRPACRLITVFTFMLAFFVSGQALSADVSQYGETGKLIRAPQALGVLGDDMFGDKVGYYTGSLEFTHADVSLPGNSSLPVAIGRRFKAISSAETQGHFGNWDIDIPHMHGIFATEWNTGIGTDRTRRCSKFGPPVDAVSRHVNNEGTFLAAEFWRGNFIYVPGHGDQEMLRRRVGNALAANDLPANYPVVTRNNWQISCIQSGAKEYFLALAPDGTTYQFDWEVSRPASRISKSTANGVQSTSSVKSASVDDAASADGLRFVSNEPLPTPNITDEGFLLDRVEVFLFPTVVTDKYGNKVIYTFDPTNRWQLKTIHSVDVAVATNAETTRTLTITYPSPTSTVISAVTDGTRTWKYDYQGSPQQTLTTVTLPDASTWQLGGLAPLHTELAYLEQGSCEMGGLVGSSEVTGSLMHPSGARGQFTMTPTQHGRIGVTKDCRDTRTPGVDRVEFFKLFDTFALTRKEISGPGVQPRVWATQFPEAESSWLPCPTGGCVGVKTVAVTSPSGYVTKHRFGTVFRVNEGQMLGTDVYDAAGKLLRSTTLTYKDPVLPWGVSDQPRGDGEVAARVTEQHTKKVSQQGVVFSNEVKSFNAFGQPANVLRTSSLGQRYETTTYHNNRARWVLRLVATVVAKETSDATVSFKPVSNTYHTTFSHLLTASKFGKRAVTHTYNADGTLATSADGRSKITSFSKYKRGIPQAVKYADLSSESAVVNEIGNIDSVTDPLGNTTNFKYDAIGRLSDIIYPADINVTYFPTILKFGPSPTSYADLAAGHWVQTTKTGNALVTTHYDAMFRPAYTERMDTSDPAGTTRIVNKKYDLEGKLAFESYPKRSLAEIGSGKHSKYDALGRVLESSHDSELGLIKTSNEYTSGFERLSKDGRGFVTRYTFQAFDEPSEEAIATIVAPAPLDNIVVSIQRDMFSKPTSITRSGAGKSATRSYVYNLHQLLCKTIEPETGATIQDYDLANNVIWRATGLNLPAAACDTASVAAASKMSFSHDNRNRLTDTTFGDGSAAINRTYTLDGLVNTIASGGSVWTNFYNKRRLHESETLAYGGKSYQIARAFDANGSLTSLTYPISGLKVLLNPNAFGEPRQVGSYASGVTYHPNGALASFTYGNGIKHTLLQNERGLPYKSIDSGILSDTYVYDANANVDSITDEFKGVATRSMGYDALNRLKTVSAPAMWGNASYDYDSLDNIIGSAISGGPTARTLVHAIDPATNRLDAITGGPAAYTFSYGYDARGNITRRGAQTYVFDQANRMTSAVDRATYAYDGMGHRFSSIGKDGVNRIQIYSQGGQLLYTSSGAATGLHYIYLGRHQIAEVTK